ncbi:hypothetical protein ACFRAQ_26805 [Nocardia sp. NPDC056611]|uniref:hypothetical protein n=1 Tax=Nocardia sp. NPDC056611 TaxID=3345877 RepID=UPI00366AEC77
MTWKTSRGQRRRTVLAMVVIPAAAGLVACSGGGGPAATTTAAPGGASTTAAPGGSAPGTSGPAATTTPAAAEFPYQPLWPYHDSAEAAAWQRDAGSGHQPWHLDPAATAQSFTQHYLGFSSLDKIVKVATDGDQSRVSVGFDNPNGVPVVAAVVHLVRMGHGDTAPWEVVGTDDTTFQLTTPRYGGTVSSPVAVGGTITGVDESIRVRILRSDRDQPVGRSAPIPAGGTESSWSATVSVSDACPATLTIVAATGGHVADIERFTITGVRC